jgi:epsilon-lactone hydrolase
MSLRARLFWLLVKYLLAPKLNGLPLEEQRQFLNKLGLKAIRPSGVTIQKMVLNSTPAESIMPVGAPGDRVVLFLHGGAYTLGSCMSYQPFAAWTAKVLQMRVIVLDYPLAPEYPFPHAMNAAVEAYQALLAQGIRPSQIALMGDSAGGGLAIATALSLREKKIGLPGAIVCLSPWVDLTHSGESIESKKVHDIVLKLEVLQTNAQRYAGSQMLNHPLISPVYSGLTGLPPLLIQVGREEILLSDSIRLKDRAHNDKVDVQLEIWDHLWHVWHYFVPYLPESRQALEKIRDFLKSRLS